MLDEIVERPGTATRPVVLAPDADPVGGLEPLAVPLGRITSILRRHIWAMLGVFLLGVGGTTAVVKQMPKQYTAEATILIEPQRTQVSDLQAISPDPGDVGGLVRTQMDILRSQALAMGVVKALQLTQNAEFAPHGGGLTQKIKEIIRAIELQPNVPPRPQTQDEANQSAAAILGGKLSFANETRSSVLNVLVTTADPELSANIANEVAKQFLDFKRQEKFAAMQRAHDWFEDQLGKLAGQVSAADAAVERYRQEHRLDELPPDAGDASRTETVNRQQLNAISAQLAQVSRELALKEGQIAQARAVMRGDAPASSLPEVMTSAVVTQLISQITVVAGREAELASTQGAGNPQLIAVRAQLHKLQARVEQEMSNVVGGLTADVKAASDQEASLRHQMENLRTAVSGENSAEIGLQAPLTQARATRSIYESFLTRATQLANVAGIQEPDASLVSSARPPLGPSAPQTARLVIVAAVLSMALGVVLACVIERLRGGFSLPEQFEVTLGLPLLALVPRVSRATLRGKRKGHEGLAFTASLNRLRGHLLTLGEARPKLVMITSALPQEGKSVFAAELARNAATAGWRVMLIGCDFCHPAHAAQFGLPPAPGLSDILSGKLLGDISNVVHEPEPRLHVICAGGYAKGDSQELLASNRMAALLAAVRLRYDLVVLDTPPVLPVADALVLAKQADATVMVVRWEKTARGATVDAVRLLRSSRARVMGAVMTRVNPRTAVKSGGRMLYAFSHYDGYYVTPAEHN